MTLVISPEKESQANVSITNTIVSTVADKTGRDPLELPPLYTAIDADALTAICDSSSRPLTVEFEYAGCLVIVRAAGEVEISVEEI